MMHGNVAYDAVVVAVVGEALAVVVAIPCLSVRSQVVKANLDHRGTGSWHWRHLDFE